MLYQREKGTILNKRELVDQVSYLSRENKTTVNLILNTFFKVAMETLKDDNLKITGFGTFYIQEQKERLVKIPSRETYTKIPIRKVVKFKAGKQFKEQINSKE